MAYIACLPPFVLQPYIYAYWQVAWEKTSAASGWILPDGCLDVLLNLGTTMLNRRGPHYDLPSGSLTLIGSLTRPVRVDYACGNVAFGIRFKPAGLRYFMAIPLQHTQDELIDLTAFAPTFAQHLLSERLLEARTFAEQCRVASAALLAQLGRTPAPEPRLWYAVEQIQAGGGRLSVGKAAELACMSPRQFERRFTALVGLPPKQLAELVRFRAVCHHLQTTPTASLAAVAFKMGYYDAAHLSRVFHRYAGQPPSRYRAQ